MCISNQCKQCTVNSHLAILSECCKQVVHAVQNKTVIKCKVKSKVDQFVIYYNHAIIITLVYNWRHYWAHQKQFCKSTPVYTHRYITNLLDSLDTQFHEWLQNETLATYTGHVWSQDGWILIDQDLVFACLQPDTCAVKVPKYEISSHCDAISIFSEGFVICQGTSFSCRTRQSISSGQDNPILPSQVAYGALQTLRIVKGKQLHCY